MIELNLFLKQVSEEKENEFKNSFSILKQLCDENRIDFIKILFDYGYIMRQVDLLNILEYVYTEKTINNETRDFITKHVYKYHNDKYSINFFIESIIKKLLSPPYSDNDIESIIKLMCDIENKNIFYKLLYSIYISNVYNKLAYEIIKSEKVKSIDDVDSTILNRYNLFKKAGS